MIFLSCLRQSRIQAVFAQRVQKGCVLGDDRHFDCSPARFIFEPEVHQVLR